MTNKEIFIKEIEDLISDGDILSDEAMTYFESLKKDKGHSKVITENGAKILEYLQQNWESKNNIFKATEIGEGLFMSGRSVSGSIRKLVSLGLVEKQGKDPVCHSITDIGKTKEFD